MLMHSLGIKQRSKQATNRLVPRSSTLYCSPTVEHGDYTVAARRIYERAVSIFNRKYCEHRSVELS
jgi:hypothetical protein